MVTVPSGLRKALAATLESACDDVEITERYVVLVGNTIRHETTDLTDALNMMSRFVGAHLKCVWDIRAQADITGTVDAAAPA